MARKQYGPRTAPSAESGKDEAPAKRKDTKRQKDLLVRIHDRFKVMAEGDRDNRTKAMADLKFLHIPGEQWDKAIVKERGADRPCYEFNKTLIKAMRISNDMRANRPQGKVRATEDSDKDKADIYEGLSRNIWNNSDGDTVADYAGEYQVGGGMGAWRIDTEYVDEDVFEQDIKIRPIKNPFTLYWDPAASDPLKRDAEDWINTEKLSKAVFEAKYPKAERISFEDLEFDDEDDWEDEETVRICEYWYKERYSKTLLQLDDGKVVEATSDGGKAMLAAGKVKRTREVMCDRIKMCIASGAAILEESDWAGKRFPFVVVHGKWIVIDGKVEWCGVVRNAKDAQRSYNVARTAVTEKIALSPNAPFWATHKQAEGNMDKWADAHKKLYPVMLYNPDPQAPGAPQRMGGDDIPIALIQEVQIADQELKDVMGVYDPALGAKSNETSGRAITRRAEQSELVNFHYPDNMAKAIRYTWELLVDLIPKVYDTERSIRILGPDGAEKYVKINTAGTDERTGKPIVVNDLAEGRYDVVVSTGPSFTTQRQEASEIYAQLAQSIPQLAVVAPDLIAKTLDYPYSEEMADRLRMTLPPQIQQQLDKDKPMPPEVQAAMAQVEQMSQAVQQQSQLVQQAAVEADQKKAEAEKAGAHVQTLIEKLKTEEARFEAQVAKAEAQIAQKSAQMAERGATDAAAGDRAALSTEVQQAVAQLQQMYANFMQQVVGILAEIQARGQPVVNMPASPRIKGIKRDQGMLVPIYADETVQ